MPATEPAIVPATEPAIVPATEPAVVPATEPAVVPATKPAVVPATKPAVVPATEPAVVPATEPAVVPATEPAVVPATEPAVVPATEPAVVPATEPAVVPATEPAVVPATEPAVVPVTEPAVVLATEPAVVPVTKPTLVLATKPAVLPMTESAIVPAQRVLTSIWDIEIEFGKMTNKIEEALVKAKINVAKLIKQLSAITVAKNKQVPLFGEDVFEKIQSIDDLWKKLKDFWHIFDYEVLECVIEFSDCREAQDIFEYFISRIDPSAIKGVDLVLHCKEEHWEGSLKPVLRVKVKTEFKANTCTKEVVSEVKRVVSQAYELEKYKLCFRGIKKGCIEMVYYISKPLKLYLLNFAITGSNMAEFLAHDIISLYINDTDDEYELKVPFKIVDMVSM